MQQHGSKYLTRRHPATGGMGSKGQNSDMVMLHISLKGITKCSSMVINNLPADPTPPPPPHRALEMGSVGQNSLFSEHGHVAYQIKEYHECSNMVANILSPDISRPWVWVNRSKFNFSEYGHVACQIKEIHKCSNMAANILPADTLTLEMG